MFGMLKYEFYILLSSFKCSDIMLLVLYTSFPHLNGHLCVLDFYIHITESVNKLTRQAKGVLAAAKYSYLPVKKNNVSEKCICQKKNPEKNMPASC